MEFGFNAVELGCVPNGDACEDGAPTPWRSPAECDEPTDCPDGNVCCGRLKTVGSTTFYEEISCRSTCNDGDDVIICDPADDTSQSCPEGKVCKKSSLIPSGYHFCSFP